MDGKTDHVNETFNTASEYRRHLEDLLDQLEVSICQVEHTAKKSEQAVQEHFSNIAKLINGVLERRRDQLLTEINAHRAEALVPLTECREEIVGNMATAGAMLREGENILKGEIPVTRDQICTYLGKSSLIGILPEVPNPAQVASINVRFSTDLLPCVSAAINTHGVVTPFAPVQIVHTEERPGGLIVQWAEMDEDSNEERIFGLKYCSGNVRNNPQSSGDYQLAYKGTETSYLVRDLQLRKPYSFIVSCHRTNGEWERWSEPYISMTTIPCYEWEACSSSDYILTNGNKIATKSSVCDAGLYSKSPLLRCNHSVMFHFLDIGEDSKIDEGLALIDACQVERDTALIQPGVIFINMEGNVYIDGKMMTTHLPALNRKSVVIFDVEPLETYGKVRITIHNGNQEITYDWRIRGDDKSHLGLNFAMFFRESGWKICVE